MRAAHNGEFYRNGVIKRLPISRHNGWSEHSISDFINKLMFGVPVMENMPSSDSAAMKVGEYIHEEFHKPYYRDGKITHNGAAYHTGYILDVWKLVQKLFLQDTFVPGLHHDGTPRRTGEFTHGSAGAQTAYETDLMKFSTSAIEWEIPDEKQVINFKNNHQETVDRQYRHDDQWLRNGQIYRDGKINDKFGLTFKTVMSDTNSIFEKTDIKMKGNFSETLPVAETQNLGIAHSQSEEFVHGYKRNRKYARNAAIFRSNYIIEDMVMQAAMEPWEDSQTGRIMRNADILRNGSEIHKGTQIAYEDFVIGMRYRRNHDGIFSRDSGIMHNGNVLLPINN
jgi:hypothetical protein